MSAYHGDTTDEDIFAVQGAAVQQPLAEHLPAFGPEHGDTG
jgi:hypothetical protein